MDFNPMSSVSTPATGGESFADLFAESLKSQDMKSGEVISAEVVCVDHNFVVVNAGLKSEALIRSEEHTSELQSLMRISYAVFCLKKKSTRTKQRTYDTLKLTTTHTDT